MNCNKCKKAKQLTGDNNAKCIKHGFTIMINRLKLNLQPIPLKERTYHLRVKI